jgi:hypothetical protein
MPSPSSQRAQAMSDLARNPLVSKRVFAAPVVFPLLGVQLPARLDALDPRAHAHVGTLLDAKRVRLLLDGNGRMLVARAGRP